MIKVKVNPDSITIKGHADYDDYGKDIVCSSVSSIVTTSVNAMLRLDKDSIDYTLKEGLINIKIKKESDTTNQLIDNMLNLLEDLSLQYKENIKVERE